MVYGGVSPSSAMTLPQGFAELELVMGVLQTVLNYGAIADFRNCIKFSCNWKRCIQLEFIR